MSAGPLRRASGVLGLVALVPVLLQLAAGTLTPQDAALRAAVVGLVAVLLGNVARVVLTRTLHRVERHHARRATDVGRGDLPH